MADRNDTGSVEERNLRTVIASALRPAAPPLPPGLPSQLAARVLENPPVRIDLTLAAGFCGAFGVLVLAGLALLPSGRTDLRIWALFIIAANILPGPFAAVVVIRNLKMEAFHAQT